MRLSGIVIITLFLGLAWGDPQCDERATLFLDHQFEDAKLRQFSDCEPFKALPDLIKEMENMEFSEDQRARRLAVVLEDSRNCDILKLSQVPRDEGSHHAWLTACLDPSEVNAVKTEARQPETTQIVKSTASFLGQFSKETQSLLEIVVDDDPPELVTILPAILLCQTETMSPFPQWPPSVVHWVLTDPQGLGRMKRVVAQAAVSAPSKLEFIIDLLGLKENPIQDVLWPLIEHAALVAAVAESPQGTLQRRMDIIGPEAYRQILAKASPTFRQSFSVIVDRITAYLNNPSPTTLQVVLPTSELPTSLLQTETMVGLNLPPPIVIPTTGTSEVSIGGVTGEGPLNLPPPIVIPTTGIHDIGTPQQLLNLPPPISTLTEGQGATQIGLGAPSLSSGGIPPPPQGGPPPPPKGGPPPPPLPPAPTFKVPAPKVPGKQIRPDGSTQVKILGETKLPTAQPTLGEAEAQAAAPPSGTAALLDSIRKHKKKSQRTTSQIDRDLQASKNKGSGGNAPSKGKATGKAQQSGAPLSLQQALKQAMKNTSIGKGSQARESSRQESSSWDR